MSDGERANITNGIWLCANCHDVIDGDETLYPAALLFEWRNWHERQVREQLGKKGSSMQSKVQTAKLRQFTGASPLAQQIILEQPPGWEYRLTAELLRSDLAEIQQNWIALRDGLLVKNTRIVSHDSSFDWLQAKLLDMTNNTQALSKIVNGNIIDAWGAPGQPGSLDNIRRSCFLLAGVAQNILDFEIDLRFSKVPDYIEPLRQKFFGVGGRHIEELMRIPNELSKMFDRDAIVGGVFRIDIVIDLPANFDVEMEMLVASIISDHGC
jgi:hypothetical protein